MDGVHTNRTGSFNVLWEVIEELEIFDHDTQVGDDIVPAGHSPWAMVQMADRLEARRASTSLHNYVRRTAADDYRLDVLYNDEQNAFHVRKVLLNGHNGHNGHGG